jgi:hypothetical protein
MNANNFNKHCKQCLLITLNNTNNVILSGYKVPSCDCVKKIVILSWRLDMIYIRLAGLMFKPLQEISILFQKQ